MNSSSATTIVSPYMVMLPLEVVGGGLFMRRARERFYIGRLQAEKRRGVEEIEHGLNMDKGQ